MVNYIAIASYRANLSNPSAIIIGLLRIIIAFGNFMQGCHSIATDVRMYTCSGCVLLLAIFLDLMTIYL